MVVSSKCPPLSVTMLGPTRHQTSLCTLSQKLGQALHSQPYLPIAVGTSLTNSPILSTMLQNAPHPPLRYSGTSTAEFQGCEPLNLELTATSTESSIAMSVCIFPRYLTIITSVNQREEQNRGENVKSRRAEGFVKHRRHIETRLQELAVSMGLSRITNSPGQGVFIRKRGPAIL
ncbi:hypothetical protein FA13DRAFT_1161426 [Coprinellus micaceus]|uniref:Uncharacterized protein n=1 Tax=Coprinellus micaceus TaxID=71717 RepID=A0A4Y7SWE7_COPMI|nr:hypothetical protein FA13DRAFT_1161426 [Coprinellus micaceus]